MTQTELCGAAQVTNNRSPPGRQGQAERRVRYTNGVLHLLRYGVEHEHAIRGGAGNEEPAAIRRGCEGTGREIGRFASAPKVREFRRPQ